MQSRFVLAALLATLALPAAAEPIAVEAKALPFNPADPQDLRLGPLAFLDALELTSPDPRFGGWSGMVVDGSRVLLVADTGHWLVASLAEDGAGRLTGLAEAQLLPLLDPAGKPVQGKAAGDAESLARLADGTLLVGFEQDARLWSYRDPAQAAVPLPLPPALDGRNDNDGLEALARWPGGAVGLLEGSEEFDATMGFLWDGARYLDIVYPLEDGFRVSDAALLPDPEGEGGGLLVLERFYTPAEGVKVRLQWVDAGQVREHAFLEPQLWGEIAPPRTVDNFEALAAVREPSGRTLVYLLSDDNLNRASQRTLLLRFELTYE